jgi:hypothetical protein
MRMHTFEETGYKPEPISSRIFVRCYRRFRDANRAYDQLRVVAGIPDKRMTVVARNLEWRESLPAGALLKLAAGAGTGIGAVVALSLWLLGITDTGWLAQTVLGALAGLAAGLVAAAGVIVLRRRYTGVAQTGHVEPRQYDILVEEDYAEAARAVLEAQ